VEKDLQMLRDLGLDPDWDEFDESEAGGCGCGEKDSCGTPGTPESVEVAEAVTA